MSLGESLEELETLDVPRGVVRAANLYGQHKVQLAARLKGMSPYEDEQVTLHQAQEDMEMYFDAFIAGAKWAEQARTKVGD